MGFDLGGLQAKNTKIIQRRLVLRVMSLGILIVKTGKKNTFRVDYSCSLVLS